MNRNVWAAGAATLVVIAVVILGFHALGGPQKQRLVQADLRTVQRLANLARQINMKWNSSNKILPADLQSFPKSATEDPITHRQTTYRRKSDSAYELCAVFAAESRSAPDPQDSTTFWSHPKGEYCFQFDATEQVPLTPYYFQLGSFAE